MKNKHIQDIADRINLRLEPNNPTVTYREIELLAEEVIRECSTRVGEMLDHNVDDADQALLASFGLNYRTWCDLCYRETIACGACGTKACSGRVATTAHDEPCQGCLTAAEADYPDRPAIDYWHSEIDEWSDYDKDC